MADMLRSCEQKEVFVYKGADNYSIWLSFKESSAQLGNWTTIEDDLKLRNLCQMFYFFSLPQEVSLFCTYPDLMRLSPFSSIKQFPIASKKADNLLARG